MALLLGSIAYWEGVSFFVDYLWSLSKLFINFFWADSSAIFLCLSCSSTDILGGVEKLYLLMRRFGIGDSVSFDIWETLDLLGSGVSPWKTTDPVFT